VPESFTHGTSEQRVSWLKKGLDTGDLTREVAVAAVQDFALVHDAGLAQPVLADVGGETVQFLFSHQREDVGDALGDLVGQVFALLVLTVAAAEAAIGLAILVVFYRNRGSIAVEDVNLMKG